MRPVDLIACVLGLAIGVSSFSACGLFEPCGDQQSVERYSLRSGDYIESRHRIKEGTADVPLRHAHGEKSLTLDLEAGELRITYLDLELRPVQETWRVGAVRDVEGTY